MRRMAVIIERAEETAVSVANDLGRSGGDVLSFACIDSAEGVLWHVMALKAGVWHRLATCEKTRVDALLAALEGVG